MTTPRAISPGDEPENRPLSISPEKAFYILVKAREFDAKVAPADSDGGSNPADDLNVEVLEDRSDDPTAEELMTALESLNEDEQLDLIALVWIGRGDFTLDEWPQARRQAEEMTHKHIPQYLVQTPLVSDYLDEGLAQVGYSLEEYEINRL